MPSSTDPLAPPAPVAAPRRRRTWLLVTALVAAPVLGLVALVGGAYALLAFGPGESSAPHLATLEAIPAPSGAVVLERFSRDGTPEVGASARVAYRLPVGEAPASCANALHLLRRNGWELRTAVEYRPDARPLPQDLTATCREVAADALVVTAQRTGGGDEVSVVLTWHHDHLNLTYSYG